MSWKALPCRRTALRSGTSAGEAGYRVVAGSVHCGVTRRSARLPRYARLQSVAAGSGTRGDALAGERQVLMRITAAVATVAAALTWCVRVNTATAQAR
ncbi:hypothetical protein GCM10022222_76120 [Amycolatopsis ultiminotia]|uniref:Uncharacterized protein n=1 Tax=Amycolatopsis ultiminotia TaxID=543629 RepID=A0ABP6YC24_9PSEU